MNEDYRKEIVEIERGIVETYLKIIIQYYPNLDKPKRNELVKEMVEKS